MITGQCRKRIGHKRNLVRPQRPACIVKGFEGICCPTKAIGRRDKVNLSRRTFSRDLATRSTQGLFDGVQMRGVTGQGNKRAVNVELP